MALTEANLIDAVSGVARWRRGDEFAPHKPLTLLYALGRIAQGSQRLFSFAESRSPLTELLVEFGPKRESIHPEYPFQRLCNDGIWELVPSGLEPRKSNTDATPKVLLEANAQAGFSQEVYDLLKANPGLVEDLGARILDSSFPESLHDPIRSAVGLDEAGTEQGHAKDRDPTFRTKVLDAYGHQCAICGFDVRVGRVGLAVEAAHIKWHQQGGPAVVPNGVAMCAIHHSVFDRGAFSISLDFKVMVATSVSRSESAKLWMWRFDGHRLQLPPKHDLLPEATFVKWHHANVFRGQV